MQPGTNKELDSAIEEIDYHLRNLAGELNPHIVDMQRWRDLIIKRRSQRNLLGIRKKSPEKWVDWIIEENLTIAKRVIKKRIDQSDYRDLLITAAANCLAAVAQYDLEAVVNDNPNERT